MVQESHQIIKNLLKKFDIEEFDPTGNEYNPNLQESLMEIPTPPGFKANHVAMTMRTGYTIKGRLLRSARVGIFSWDVFTLSFIIIISNHHIWIFNWSIPRSHAPPFPILRAEKWCGTCWSPEIPTIFESSIKSMQIDDCQNARGQESLHGRSPWTRVPPSVSRNRKNNWVFGWL